MHKLIGYTVSALFVCFALTAGAFAKGGAVHVNGYTRKDGTYVAPHYRSAPNSTKADNWSTQGNVNPYTGKEGTKPVDGTSNSASNASSATSATPPSQNNPPASIASDAPESVNLTKPSATKAKGIYFTKYESLTREELLQKVTELDQRNAQLERRVAELEDYRRAK